MVRGSIRHTHFLMGKASPEYKLNQSPHLFDKIKSPHLSIPEVLKLVMVVMWYVSQVISVLARS